MHVREATADDRPSLVDDLLVPSFRASERVAPTFNELDEEAVETVDGSYWLDDDDRALFVAVEDETLVGHVAGGTVNAPPIFARGPRLHVDGLYVVPDRREEGVASTLLARIEAWGKAQGCSTVGVTVHEDNDPARELYERRYDRVYRGYRGRIE